MYNIGIFAGTSEGRKIAEFVSGQSVCADVFVATEYGEALITPTENTRVFAMRLSREEMKVKFAEKKYDLVIDATHPYATDATSNIKAACGETETEYVRVVRDKSSEAGDCVYVSDADEAVELLNKCEGNIFLASGSKEISKYKKIKDFSERVCVRILPSEENIKACMEAGVRACNIIAMQGPFSEEMNVACLRKAHAKYLVTKESGSLGGFGEKIKAAQKAGACIVVIGRPNTESGVSLTDAIRLICEKIGCVHKPRVTIVGTGVCGGNGMSTEAKAAIFEADCIIGAKRMTAEAEHGGKEVFTATDAGSIAEFISAHTEYKKFAVLMSGDTGFYSGTKRLVPLLSECDVKILPGISSLSYLCSKLNKSYENTRVLSIHGRCGAVVSTVKKNQSVFVLVGGENGVEELCERLCAAGLSDVKLYIGERLGYQNEKITEGSAGELCGMSYDKLSAVLIENDKPDLLKSSGFPDDMFLRNQGAETFVPMTKSEVRAVCLSKLMICENSVCWDIGAGSGSVSAEMARLAQQGRVYAIEYKKEALELIEKNIKKFGTDNVEIINGRAPDGCGELPAPTHAFIGGSSGSLKEIFSLLLAKNPAVRIVATAVTLETVTRLTECMREFGFDKTEVTAVSVSRSDKKGNYTFMNSQNTVYIFTMQKEN